MIKPIAQILRLLVVCLATLTGAYFFFTYLTVPWSYGATFAFEFFSAIGLTWVLAEPPSRRQKQTKTRGKVLGNVVRMGSLLVAVVSVILLGLGPIDILDPFRLLCFSLMPTSLLIFVISFYMPPFSDLVGVTIFLSIFIFGATNNLNTLWDESAFQTRDAKVLKLLDFFEDNRSVLILTDGLPEFYFTLSSKDSRQVQIGDKLKLKFKSGRIGIPWVQSYTLVRETK